MKYNLIFYLIAFLSLMLVNIVANSIEKDKNYQNNLNRYYQEYQIEK